MTHLLEAGQLAKAKAALQKEKDEVWILKPTGCNRGVGIEVCVARTILGRLRKGTIPKNYLVQSYIKNPLLLNNSKFDIRAYVWVVTTSPLMVLWHPEGYCRLSGAEYSM